MICVNDDRIYWGIGEQKKSCYNDVSIVNASTKETDGM